MSYDIEQLGTEPAKAERFEYVALEIVGRILDTAETAGNSVSDFKNSHTQVNETLTTGLLMVGSVALSTVTAFQLVTMDVSRRIINKTKDAANRTPDRRSRRDLTIFAPWINGK